MADLKKKVYDTLDKPLKNLYMAFNLAVYQVESVWVLRSQLYSQKMVQDGVLVDDEDV